VKTYIQMKSIQDFNKKALLGALLAAGMVMGSGSAGAATAPGTLTVTANVVAACTIGNATLDFSAYNPNASIPLDGQVNVNVNCTKGSPFHIFSTTANADRKMTHETDTSQVLTYQLFATNTDRTNNTYLPVAKGTGDLVGTGTGITQTIPIFGQIAAGQNVIAGSYTGTANLTIDF
jgi:spore coat protein U-like protein